LTIRRLVLVTSGAVIVVIAAALVTNTHIAGLETRVRVVEEQRVRGLELCEEMLQTTNQLTRTVRWYAVFGDPKYETIYRRILSVRSGQEPRPRRIQDDFWMDVMVDRVPPVAKGAPLSLDAMIEQSGIPAEAAAKIRESLRHSDRLAKAEEIAFAARKGKFDDGMGNLVREGPPDELLAKTLLFSRDYEAARDGILRPIQECREVVLRRHAEARAELDRALGTARSVRMVIWDFSEPGVARRREYNVGVVTEWVARGLPASANFEVDAIGFPKRPWGVRLKVEDAEGRLAIDQILQPRAHK